MLLRCSYKMDTASLNLQKYDPNIQFFSQKMIKSYESSKTFGVITSAMGIKTSRYIGISSFGVYCNEGELTSQKSYF